MNISIKFFVSLLVAVSMLVIPFRLNYPPVLNIAQGYSQAINVWWPTSNATLSGIQPFKAMLNNADVGNYRMYWQVDNGQWNIMNSNYSDYPHKEALVDVAGWNWSATGMYHLNFIATDINNIIVSQQAEDVRINPPAASATSVPLSSSALYVNQNSAAKQWAAANQLSHPADALLMNTIANQPAGQWFGDWNANVYADVSAIMSAAATNKSMPVLVAYNIPNRDCGGYSSGGALNAAAYKSWVQSFAQAIGNSKAIVVVEPDALANMGCLSPSGQQERIALLDYAIGTFKILGNTSVYIDAGNPSWIDAATMASRLKQAGVQKADGFSLNVSSFFTMQDNIDYGKKISALISGKHFIVDTSRNGLGPASDYQWCNPAGRGLGLTPTLKTGNTLVDAYLWIKNPTESDGNCNGGPAAGIFWASYALSLARSVGW